MTSGPNRNRILSPRRNRWRFAGLLWFMLAVPLTSLANSYFEAACLNILGEDANTVLYLETQPKLLHIDEGSGNLLAKMRVNIRFRKPETHQIVYSREIAESRRHDFMSGESDFLYAYRFDLAPGRYEVLIEVRDEFTNRTHFTRLKYDCYPLNQGTSLSDIVLVQEFGGILAAQPLLGEHIRALPERLTFRTEVYTGKEETFTARTILYRRQDDHRRLGDDGERMQVNRYSAIFQVNEIIDARAGRNVYEDQLALGDLPHGEYLLEVFLYRDETLIAEESRTFIIDWKHLRTIFGDLDQAIDMMAYVASEQRRVELKAVADPDEKQRRFLAFWNQRNEPGRENNLEALERYYDRIFYANEHFPESRAGWQTDRGRVYVLYGAPERQSSFREEDLYFELWTYRKWGLRFIFRVVDGLDMMQVYPQK
ncbi:MAG: GWxTD domain-containing protein [Bacteroidota bacterium]